MYTHLHVTRDDARRLFAEFARKPLRPGESGTVMHSTFEAHFNDFGLTYLDKLGAHLAEDRRTGNFVLNFDRYLARLPQEIVDMGILVVRAEIVRMKSAPIRARAGFYEAVGLGFAATVERVFPAECAHYAGGVIRRGGQAMLYAQNIRVSGPSLEAVQEFNTKLSTGSYSRFLVNAFE